MTRRLVLLSMLALASLAGCAGGGPPKRVFPPEARLQELRLAPGGATVLLRVESFSTVPSTLETVALTLRLGDGPDLVLAATPGTAILPEAAEVVELPLALPDAERRRVEDAIAQRRALRYRLAGTLRVDPPGRDHPIDYSSALSPAPGLEGVMR